MILLLNYRSFFLLFIINYYFIFALTRTLLVSFFFLTSFHLLMLLLFSSCCWWWITVTTTGFIRWRRIRRTIRRSIRIIIRRIVIIRRSGTITTIWLLFLAMPFNMFPLLCPVAFMIIFIFLTFGVELLHCSLS